MTKQLRWAMVSLFFIAVNTAHASPPLPTKICVTGDAGYASSSSPNTAQAAVGKAMDRAGCTHVIALGDNFYPRGVESASDSKFKTLFEAPYQRLLARNVPFYMVLGNHDYQGNTQAQLDYALTHANFVMPARSYAFEIDSLCFYVVDTTRMSLDQVSWLKTQFLRGEKCSYKIVMGHHPILSSGVHGNTGGDVAALLKPALDSADLYLAGHDHHMSDEGTFRSGTRLVRQLISGAGGAPLRPVPVVKNPDYRFGTSEYGFMVLDAQMQWTFYDTELRSLYSGDLRH